MTCTQGTVLVIGMLSTMTVDTTQIIAGTYIVVLGLGMGLVMPTLTIALQSAFPPEERGVVTSSSQFFRSIGGTLGVTILGVVMNNRSVGLLRQHFFPIVERIPGIKTGPFAGLLAKAEENPHGLFNALLAPETLAKLPPQLREVMVPPLKLALTLALHSVFLVAMGVVMLGIVASLLVGNVRLSKDADRRIQEF